MSRILLRSLDNDFFYYRLTDAGLPNWLIKSNRITTPRSRGASPKEIQPSNQGISFGEKGAGKRKIEAQARFDVNFMASCRFDCFNSMKPYKRLEPRGSNGAVALGQ